MEEAGRVARFDIIVIRTFCFVTELLLNCTEIKIKGMTEILSVPSHNQPQPFTLKPKQANGIAFLLKRGWTHKRVA